MKKYVLIGLGGFLGANLRYIIKNTNMFGYQGSFPLNTLFINVTGSFLLAFLLTAALKSVRFDSDLKLGLTTGFLGAFTTFSTFCKEVYLLISSGNYYITALYIILSVIFGFTAAYIGAVTIWELKSENHKQADQFYRNQTIKNTDDEAE